MKIIVFMPITDGKYEDDTSLHCRALETYGGHTIYKIRHMIRGDKLSFEFDESEDDKLGTADVIWCPYEDMLVSAVHYSKENNIPIVGHFEIVLPGRVFLDSVDVHWWTDLQPFEENKMAFYYSYRGFLENYLKCDVKTIMGKYHKYRCEKIIGKHIGETFIKPYPFDNKLFDDYKKNDVEEKNQICSIYRPVIYKKTAHILKALSLLENPPKYIIAGEDKRNSVVMDKLKTMVKELNLDVEFVGSITDEEKVKLIQESMFSFSHYGALPPTEAAYLKKPCVCYFEPDIYDRLNDLPYYVQTNNIEELAKTIKELSEDKQKRKEVGEKAYNILINNKCHTHLLKEDSRLLTEIFEKAVKK